MTRETLIRNILESGTTVSKTGAVYRDPISIIKSEKAQKDLEAISKLRKVISC